MTSLASRSIHGLVARFDELFFAPIDIRVCGVLRIVYATLLLVNVLVWAPDVVRWFGESGVLPFGPSRMIVDPDTLTLFSWLPQRDGVAIAAYVLLLVHIVLLGVGFFTRVQAVGVCLCLISFLHRNIFIFDGEDNVFRLLAIAFVVLPVGHAFSVDAWRRRRQGRPYADEAPAWGLRLVQFQMSTIYLSTAWEKLRGADWIDGTALYYITHLDEWGRRFPVPHAAVESAALISVATWSVLAIELFVPFGLWFRPTRRAALALAVLLHLGIEFTMNIFLFEWIMIAGLLSFTTPEDLAAVKALVSRWRRPRQGSPLLLDDVAPAGDEDAAIRRCPARRRRALRGGFRDSSRAGTFS